MEETNRHTIIEGSYEVLPNPTDAEPGNTPEVVIDVDLRDGRKFTSGPHSPRVAAKVTRAIIKGLERKITRLYQRAPVENNEL